MTKQTFVLMIAAVRKSSAPYNWYAHRQLTFAALFILVASAGPTVSPLEMRLWNVKQRQRSSTAH